MLCVCRGSSLVLNERTQFQNFAEACWACTMYLHGTTEVGQNVRTKQIIAYQELRPSLSPVRKRFRERWREHSIAIRYRCWSIFSPKKNQRVCTFATCRFSSGVDSRPEISELPNPTLSDRERIGAAWSCSRFAIHLTFIEILLRLKTRIPGLKSRKRTLIYLRFPGLMEIGIAR